jgi:hypothetical protein
MYDGSIRTLTDVRHEPELRKNLISLGFLYYVGYKCTTQGGVMKVFKGILQVMKENMIKNLYQLEGRTQSYQKTMISESACDSTHLWNQHLGHMREKGLKVLVDRTLLPSLKSLNLNLCKHCIYGKHNRKKFKNGIHSSKGVLDYIDLDVWGPSPTVSYGGSSYFVTFIDEFSRKLWVYLLKRKDNVFIFFK